MHVKDGLAMLVSVVCLACSCYDWLHVMHGHFVCNALAEQATACRSVGLQFETCMIATGQWVLSLSSLRLLDDVMRLASASQCAQKFVHTFI